MFKESIICGQSKGRIRRYFLRFQSIGFVHGYDILNILNLIYNAEIIS